MVSVMDLKHGECRYACGDPRQEGFGFCGAPVERGSYCNHHRTIVYAGVWRPAA